MDDDTCASALNVNDAPERDEETDEMTKLPDKDARDAFADKQKTRGEIKRGMKGTLPRGTNLYIDGQRIRLFETLDVEITSVNYDEYGVRFLNEGNVVIGRHGLRVPLAGFLTGWLSREESHKFQRREQT